MKPLIVGVALIYIFSFAVISHEEHNQLLRQQDILKDLADECSNTASLYYDLEGYGSGSKTFNQDEGLKAIKYIIEKQQNNFWYENLRYKSYFYDDSNTVFPIMHEGDGYCKLIIVPTIVVEINGGRPIFRINKLNRDIIRSSAYEYEN